MFRGLVQKIILPVIKVAGTHPGAIIPIFVMARVIKRKACGAYAIDAQRIPTFIVVRGWIIKIVI
jgi:hypothetical protein